MSRRIRSALAVAGGLVVVLLAPGDAVRAAPEEGFSVAGGIGMTASPSSFLMQFEAPYGFGGGFSLAPTLQVGVGGRTTIVSPSLSGRYDFDFGLGSSGVASEIKPFVVGSLGMSWIEDEKKWKGYRRSDDGIGFLMGLGFGVSYPLLDDLDLETSMRFNVIPDGAGPHDSDHFYFSWLIGGARYSF